MTHFRIAVSIVLVLAVLVAAVLTTLSFGATAVAQKKANGCHNIEGGRVCYVDGHWYPQCLWPYRAIFPLKRCVLGVLK